MYVMKGRGWRLSFVGNWQDESEESDVSLGRMTANNMRISIPPV